MCIPVAITILCTLQTLSKQFLCLHLIDLPQDYGKEHSDQYSDGDSSNTAEHDPNVVENRRYWLVNEKPDFKSMPVRKRSGHKSETDDNLKSKISTLVHQTLFDTEQKINSVQNIKEQYRDKEPYRVGFILSMVKKSRDVLNELFNVAVRHRDDWKALEQMKIFELIVHTNVDTTNLVRQLVEIHIQYLNSTGGKNTLGHIGTYRKRVVLI